MRHKVPLWLVKSPVHWSIDLSACAWRKLTPGQSLCGRVFLDLRMEESNGDGVVET
jgi:hypothetical protein